LPNPWYGSPNTIFDGDAGYATSSDPDEAGVLFHNATSQAVTLTAFSIVSSTDTWTIWNSNIGTGQKIAAGGNLIFSGNNLFSMDGSDGRLNNSTVYWTINGVSASAADVTVNNGTDHSLSTGVLTGSVYGSGNETLPWIQIANVSAVPEPESCALMLIGLGLIGLVAYRRNNDSSGMPMSA